MLLPVFGSNLTFCLNIIIPLQIVSHTPLALLGGDDERYSLGQFLTRYVVTVGKIYSICCVGAWLLVWIIGSTAMLQ